MSARGRSAAAPSLLRRLAWTAAALPLVLTACAPAAPGPTARRARTPLEAADLVPRDLDVVLRFDLGRLRDALGPAALEEIARRAAPPAGDDDLVARALRHGRVALVGLRAGAVQAGDRVVVVAGRLPGLVPDATRWRRVAGGEGGIEVWSRSGPVARGEVARVVVLPDRGLLFATPVEAPAVERVLRSGPDDGRLDPPAAGLFSVDARPRAVPAPLARRYPRGASLLDALRRVRAQVEEQGPHLVVDGALEFHDEAGAERALRFLEVIRDGLLELGPERAALARGVELERLARVVRVRVRLSPEVVAGWLRVGGGGAPPEAAR